MRIDKFLKVTRLIKRREVAKQMLILGYISLNDKTAKPSTEVKVGDCIKFNIPNKRELIIHVEEIANNATIQKATELYRIEGEQDANETREEK
jgi:ribosomal 50S subunit-recycling heat shock protein